ncbi:MAG TPA: hypothetical protein VL332_08905 [Candidatus Saccharimonadaceae bacterium]|nr:hypothetical protein [Candidatus Saccharimonadaceae bacterium]
MLQAERPGQRVREEGRVDDGDARRMAIRRLARHECDRLVYRACRASPGQRRRDAAADAENDPQTQPHRERAPTARLECESEQQREPGHRQVRVQARRDDRQARRQRDREPREQQRGAPRARGAREHDHDRRDRAERAEQQRQVREHGVERADVRHGERCKREQRLQRQFERKPRPRRPARQRFEVRRLGRAQVKHRETHEQCGQHRRRDERVSDRRGGPKRAPIGHGGGVRPAPSVHCADRVARVRRDRPARTRRRVRQVRRDRDQQRRHHAALLRARREPAQRDRHGERAGAAAVAPRQKREDRAQHARGGDDLGAARDPIRGGHAGHRQAPAEHGQAQRIAAEPEASRQLREQCGDAQVHEDVVDVIERSEAAPYMALDPQREHDERAKELDMHRDRVRPEHESGVVAADREAQRTMSE